MNKENRISELENIALIYAITHLDGYKRGESSMQKYYFPIKNLSEAINNADNIYDDELEEESGLSF